MHNLIAYIGRFGTGKSLAMVIKAIEYSNKYKLIIVTNVRFDKSAYTEYCKLKGYKWASKCRIRYYDMTDNMGCLEEMLSYPNSVVLIDEAGSCLNSRNWAGTSQTFLKALFQLRHDNIIVLAGYQFSSQVDKQLRELLQQVIVCSSVAPRDRSGRPRLAAYWRHLYDPEKFRLVEFENPTPIRRWMLADKVEYQLVAIDKLVNIIKVSVLNFFTIFRSILTCTVIPLRPHTLPIDLVFRIYNSFSSSRKHKFHAYVSYPDGLVRRQERTGLLIADFQSKPSRRKRTNSKSVI